MKAYEIMAYLIIFNLVVSIFGSLSIIVLKISTYSFTTIVFSTFLVTILGWMGTSAVIGYLFTSTRPAASYWSYKLFGSVFWSSYTSSLIVIDSIIANVIPFGLDILIYGVFTIMVGYTFIAGIIQMTTGGWRSYK